jgi:CBS-domain-containing membrane protein
MAEHHSHHHHGHHHHHDDGKKRVREEEDKTTAQSGHGHAAAAAADSAKRSRTDEVAAAGGQQSRWAQLVSGTTVGDLVHHRIKRAAAAKGAAAAAPDQHLVAIEGDFTVGAAMDLLARHDLLSAPVIDPSSRRFLGFVDVLDIAGYILASYSAHADDTNFLKKELLNEQVSHILSTRPPPSRNVKM